MFPPEVKAVLDKVKRPANKIIIAPTCAQIDVAADPFGSWLGHIGAMRADERWPHWYGAPMVPLCQINTAELPVRPEIISDLALICVWMAPRNSWEGGAANGNGWHIRCYPSLDGLMPINHTFSRYLKSHPAGFLMLLMQFARRPEPAPIKWQMVDDYPYDSYVEDLLTPAEYKLYCDISSPGTFDPYLINEGKVGGWPSVMDLTPIKIPPEAEFAFQLASYPDIGWSWGSSSSEESGYGYFSRSKIDKNRWFFDYISWT